MQNRSWKVGVNKRWRIPFWGQRALPYIPQPRWLRRWYYRKSYEWWGHPSNHHWKGWLIGDNGVPLQEGERDLWTGCYRCGPSESAHNATSVPPADEKTQPKKSDV